MPDGLAQSWRARMLAPSLATGDLPGIGGVLRACAEDFAVDELPAYPPDGRAGGHALVQLRKRGLATDEATEILARALKISQREIGVAGRKDRDAFTRQWISVPASSLPALAAFRHDAIELGTPQLHSHKLRIGHLHGNRFAIVVRRTVPDAIDRAAAKIERINDEGGLVNAFGPQRFGPEGRGLDRGLAALRGGRGGPRGNMIVAAGQAALFNLWLELRRERGLARRALVGDVLAKRGTGGLFTCTDPVIDDERLADGELVVTGPIFGSRTMAPPEGSPSDALEREVLAIADVDPSALRALGRAAVGTRRASFVSLVDVALSRAEPLHDHGDGVRVEVTLPAGSYATQLCRELQEEAPQAP